MNEHFIKFFFFYYEHNNSKQMRKKKKDEQKKKKEKKDLNVVEVQNCRRIRRKRKWKEKKNSEETLLIHFCPKLLFSFFSPLFSPVWGNCFLVGPKRKLLSPTKISLIFPPQPNTHYYHSPPNQILVMTCEDRPNTFH